MLRSWEFTNQRSFHRPPGGPHMPPLKAHGPLGLCLPSSFSHDSPTFRESRIWASCLGSRGREPHSFQVRMPWTLIHKSFVVVHSALWSFWLFWCLHIYMYIYIMYIHHTYHISRALRPVDRALGHFMFSLIGLKRINTIFQRL